MIERFHGHLKLECGIDEFRRTRIERQSVKAPFHISKPYWDGKVLTIQVVNPTAGLFSGDVLESDLSVTTGAKVLMTTPSASRVHISRGGSAHVIQRFHVGNNGWLEYSPSMLMPQAGSLYRQVSEVYVEYGGDLFFMEMLAPGRVARGEYFKFKELDWTFNLHYDQKLICRERFVLEPNEDSCYALQNPIPNAWFAGGYIVSSRLSDSKGVLEQLRSLNDEHIRVGISRLYDYCWTVRLLACNGILMRKTISTLRELLSGILPELKTKCRVV